MMCGLDNCLDCPSGDVCDTCIDSVWSSNVDGECKCRYDDEQFNVEHVCIECKVDGCEMCEADAFQSYTCHSCKDPSATI